MMKFCLLLVTFFSALSYTSAAGTVQIYEDFLSPEECEGFLRQAKEKLSVSPNAGFEDPRFRFKTPIDRGINERLIVALNNLSAVSCENDDHDDQTCKASGDIPQVQEPEVYISSILRSTGVHKDSIVDKNDKPLDPDGFKVGFVFLDNNDKGYFLHGQDKIEAKKGSFVTFDGRVEHNTVVPSGAKTPIHLLGPFTMTTDKKLSLVGGHTPELNDDSASTSDGAAIEIDVIDNDFFDINFNVKMTSANYDSASDALTQPAIVSGNGVTDAGTAADVRDGLGGKTGVILYQPADGFVGTVQFTYGIYSGYDTGIVTVTVLADVKDIQVNENEISPQTAFNLVNPGLRQKVVLSPTSVSPIVIDGIIDQVTVTDNADFLSKNSPAAVRFNAELSFSDFFCKFINCDN
jgi:hypothetical protein